MQKRNVDKGGFGSDALAVPGDGQSACKIGREAKGAARPIPALQPPGFAFIQPGQQRLAQCRGRQFAELPKIILGEPGDVKEAIAHGDVRDPRPSAPRGGQGSSRVIQAAHPQICHRDESGSLRRHFLLIATLCRYVSGDTVAGDDALDARWFPLDSLDSGELALSLDVAAIARQGARLHAMSSAQDTVEPKKSR